MKLLARLALGGAIALLLTSEAGAQGAPSPSAPSLLSSPGQVITPSSTKLPRDLPATSSGSGVQLAIYLCLLVALLGGGTYFLKNGFTLPQPKNKGARKLNVSETRMLGNRQFLVVAEYEGRKMLLGVCPGRIELLSDLGGKPDETFATQLSEVS